MENLAPVKDLARLEDRRALLAGFSQVQRKLDREDSVGGLDRFQQQALEMITAPAVRQAFDIKQEPAETFERYGRGKYTHQADYKILYDWDPKPFILARRLVEAGVRVVTLQVGSWDHHSLPTQHIFKSYRHVLPVLDQNICALVSDWRSAACATTCWWWCSANSAARPSSARPIPAASTGPRPAACSWPAAV